MWKYLLKIYEIFLALFLPKLPKLPNKKLKDYIIILFFSQNSLFYYKITLKVLKVLYLNLQES